MNWRRLFAARPSRRLPEGEGGIRALGHRRYVGGHWQTLGALQLAMLQREGLQPQHRLLDVACGALRAGVHLIPYLDADRYHGLDKEPELLRAGLVEELPSAVRAAKRPRLLASSSFEAERFGVEFDFALANSLFTHLPLPLIEQCLARLRPCMAPDGRFLTTFFEVERPVASDAAPHDHGVFRYTRGELSSCAGALGWRTEYVGDFGHPRGQRLLRLHRS